MFILFGIPVITGRTFCLSFHKGNKFVEYYLYGSFFIFALIEFLGVPLVILSSSFNGLLILIVLFIFCFNLYGFIKSYLKNYDKKKKRRKKKKKKNKKKIKIKQIKIGNVIGISLICVVTAFVMFLNSRYQYNDLSSSLVIAKAGDMLNSNKMFLINPFTGEEMSWFNYADSYKDISSPWPIYIAYLSRLSGIKVSTMAHTYMAINLILLSVCVWWIFVGKLLGRNIKYRTVFIVLMLILIMYIKPNNNNISYFFYAVPWTGNAYLVLVSVVFMIICMLDYYDRSNTRNLICILICSLSICLMSYNGIYISLIMIVGFSIIYGILKKNYMLSIKLMGLIFPNLLYILIGIIVKSVAII